MTSARDKGQSPFKDAYWAIDPESNAHRTAERWRRSRAADAALMDKIQLRRRREDRLVGFGLVVIADELQLLTEHTSGSVDVFNRHFGSELRRLAVGGREAG